MQPTRRTPLYGMVTAFGGRMVDRPGFFVPDYFSNPREEHLATRSAAGLFDMFGQFLVLVDGTAAAQLLQRATVTDIDRLKAGRVVYCSMLNENGRIIDDLTIFRVSESRFWIVPTPSRVGVIEDHLRKVAGGDAVHVVSLGYRYTSLSLQGPGSRAILASLTEADIGSDSLPYFAFTTAKVAGIPDVIVSRTGFTGELGFEIFVPTEYAEMLYLTLMRAGAKDGLLPCGLAAMGTLRLEKKYLIFGRDIDETMTPVEAGLEWTIKMQKPDFLGRAAIEQQLSGGASRRMVLLSLDPQTPPPPPGCEVRVAGQRVGKVTTSGLGHSTGRMLALALIDSTHAKDGASVQLALAQGRTDPNANVHLKAVFDPGGSRARV